MIIIPDIHGRSFWKNAKEYNGTIVFLGDYIDPYPQEEITNEETILNFEEIIKFKKDNFDKVILLLGNHDCGYIWSDVCKCRRDYSNYSYIKRLFMDNLDLFNITHIVNTDKITYILSHAGVKEKFNYNELLHSKNPDDFNKLGDKLGEVSRYRGGWNERGSCVWADVHEWLDYNGPEYQIFGHTQLIDKPIITNWWACLDCRKCFKLNINDNKIKEYVK